VGRDLGGGMQRKHSKKKGRRKLTADGMANNNETEGNSLFNRLLKKIIDSLRDSTQRRGNQTKLNSTKPRPGIQRRH